MRAPSGKLAQWTEGLAGRVSLPSFQSHHCFSDTYLISQVIFKLSPFCELCDSDWEQVTWFFLVVSSSLGCFIHSSIHSFIHSLPDFVTYYIRL